MNRTRLYLVRHGQVEGHQEKRYNGQTDVSLTPVGRAQADALAERLRGEPIAAVYSSDLSRCLEGARRVAQPHGVEPIGRPELREIGMGIWEGTTWSELKERYPREWQSRLDDPVHFRVPGGENLLDVALRIRPLLREILARHRGEAVVAVAHGGVNRVILLDAIGAPLDSLFSIEQNYGCLNIVDYYEDGISVVKLVNAMA